MSSAPSVRAAPERREPASQVSSLYALPMPATNRLLRSKGFSSPGWRRMRSRNTSRVSSERRRRGPSRSSRDSRRGAPGAGGTACRASPGRRTAGPAVVETQLDARPRADALAARHEPEAPREHGVGRQDRAARRPRDRKGSGGTCLDVARRRRSSRPARSSSGVARSRIGVGAVASTTLRPGTRRTSSSATTVRSGSSGTRGASH